MVSSINWIIIGILILVGFISIRLNNLKHRFFIIILILLALFLYSSMAFTTESKDLDLSSSEGAFSASKIYFGWLANGFQNLKSITGNAIRMDWTSTNRSFSEQDNNNIKNIRRR